MYNVYILIKFIKILSNHCRFKKCNINQLNDWIIAVEWISVNKLAILFAHNYVCIYDIFNNTPCLYVIYCKEKCILYPFWINLINKYKRYIY